MTLGEQQRLFTHLVARLILWSYENGMQLTLGEAYRTPEQAALNAKAGKGIAASLHGQRLAIDMNLIIDGVYQAKSEAYKPLGDYWKSLHPLCCWGGDFASLPDGNHFSMTYGGIK